MSTLSCLGGNIFVKTLSLSWDFTTPRGRFELAIVAAHLPESVRLIIVEFMAQLIRTTGPRETLRFYATLMIYHRNMHLREPQFKVWYAHMYYENCKGYCMRCGEPSNWEHLRKNRGRLRLPKYGLSMMGMCIVCLRNGYGFNNDGDEPPALGELKFYVPNHDDKVSFNISSIIMREEV